MKLFWKIVAALLAATAVYWLVVENVERAFLFAALGAVAWFLNYRAQLREKLGDEDDTDETDETDEKETDL